MVSLLVKPNEAPREWPSSMMMRSQCTCNRDQVKGMLQSAVTGHVAVSCDSSMHVYMMPCNYDSPAVDKEEGGRDASSMIMRSQRTCSRAADSR
jgi:hypothetical protein